MNTVGGWSSSAFSAFHSSFTQVMLWAMLASLRLNALAKTGGNSSRASLNEVGMPCVFTRNAEDRYRLQGQSLLNGWRACVTP